MALNSFHFVKILVCLMYRFFNQFHRIAQPIINGTLFFFFLLWLCWPLLLLLYSWYFQNFRICHFHMRCPVVYLKFKLFTILPSLHRNIYTGSMIMDISNFTSSVRASKKKIKKILKCGTYEFAIFLLVSVSVFFFFFFFFWIWKPNKTDKISSASLNYLAHQFIHMDLSTRA